MAYPLVHLLLWFGIAGAISDNDLEIRGKAADHPVVAINDSGFSVDFSGLYCNTTMYGSDFGLDNDGRTVEAFLGIPFAANPAGPNRFREVPLKAVSRLPAKFDATIWRPGCMQEAGMFSDETSDFSENCLYLNIWRRKGTKATDRKPVVFIVHGGGYTAGDGHEIDWRGPQLAHFTDVLVVNANYRLGIFGFLDLGLRNANGHQGHIDQVTALRWLARYISYFGGDPSRVTLFGVSAGSFSISWHLMTGLSQGLFHAAIMDAGVLTHTHGELRRDHVARATRIVEANGCHGTDPLAALRGQDILNCLITIPARQLVELQQRFAPSQTYTFRPTYFNDAHLPASPECLTNGEHFRVRVPIIIGDTTNEGLFLLTERTHDEKPCLRSFDEMVEWNRRILAGHRSAQLVARSNPADRMLRCTYDRAANLVGDNDLAFGGRPSANDSCRRYLKPASQMIGDGLFVCPVMNFADHYARVQANTYFYRWDRRRATEVYPGERSDGAYHGLMFYTCVASQYLYLGGKMSSKDRWYMWYCMKMIANFSADPYTAPVFGSKRLVRHGRGMVNNFVDEGLQLLWEHPAVPRCRAVWPVFPSIRC